MQSFTFTESHSRDNEILALATTEAGSSALPPFLYTHKTATGIIIRLMEINLRLQSSDNEFYSKQTQNAFNHQAFSQEQ